MIEQTTPYGMTVRVPAPYDAALERTRAALGAEGFGVITEIDVTATFRKKLGVEFRPYIILGACAPPLAHAALSAETEIGLLLPCNVVVYAGDRPGTSVVSALDPAVALSLSSRKDLSSLADEVRDRLTRVLDAVEGAFAR